MSLITCADCGREISSLAPACIHCGRPNVQPAAAPASSATTAEFAAGPACPLCGTAVTHPNSRTGGNAWCERCGARLIYGTDGALVRVLPRAETPQMIAVVPAVSPVVVVGGQKSVGLALLLTFFFGPLGLFYSSVGGAIALCLVSIFTAGLGLVVTWPVSMIWGAYAASEHNRRLAYTVTYPR